MATHLGKTRFLQKMLRRSVSGNMAALRLLALYAFWTALASLGSGVAAAQAVAAETPHSTPPSTASSRHTEENRSVEKRPEELIIGFMGGRIHADNLVHKEASIAKELEKRNATRAKIVVFANHDGSNALKTVLSVLDTNGDHTLSNAEKQAARIAIYGHSWGASEAVNLARSLDSMGIPVLLTIQVDSVQKLGENDASIPPNVQLAVNFFQTEGLLRGRTAIQAQDPSRTRVLTNEEFHYRNSPVDTTRFPWFARTFMGPHIEIENDPRVWNRVEAMLQETIDGLPVTP